MRAVLLVLLALLGGLSVAHGEARLAIVVGRNDGSAQRRPLRHAESDARRMAEALARYGKVQPADLHLLVERPRPAQLMVVIAEVRQRLRALEHEGRESLLFFYFSGHSDGVALELGEERFPIVDLQAALRGLATVRVDIFDACRAPGLLRGADDIPKVVYDDQLASEGWVVLTASDRNESAREWPELGGIFTHHLILALSGEADRRGRGNDDGKVTLAEAFEYAAGSTLLTSAHAGHPQTPQLQLQYFTGRRASLVLAEIRPRDAWIDLPGGFDVVYLFEGTSEVLDHRDRRPLRAAVRAGQYRVVALGDQGLREAEVTVRAGQRAGLTARDLRALPALRVLRDKDGAGGPRRPRFALAAGLGVMGPVTRGAMDVLGALTLGLRAPEPSGWMVVLDLGVGATSEVTETTVLALGGYRLGWRAGRLSAAIGLLAGAGLAVQRFALPPGGAGVAPLLVGSPWGGAALRLSERWALSLEGQVPLGWTYFAGEGAHAFTYLPGGWLGLLAAR